MLKNKTEEVESISKDNSVLKEEINKLNNELKKLKRIKVVLREKDKEVINLQTSLTLAIEESNSLKEELNKLEENKKHE